MSEKTRKPFSELLEDATKQGTKLQTTSYLQEGKYPIVDQGKEQITGYTNEVVGVFGRVPCIVFGDHTRIIKLIEEPFFLGADGVKVLCPKSKYYNVKYLFYALRAVEIPDTGYNRHFKWIKESSIVVYPREQQDRIAAVLEKVDEMIALRKKQLQMLDDLIKAHFIEMFGDPVVGDKIKGNKHRIGDFASVTKLAGFEFTKYIHYKEFGDIIMLRGLNCKKGHLVLDDIKWIDKETSDLLPRSKLFYGDILITYAGTIGDVAMVDADDKYHLAPNVGRITIEDKDNYNPVYLIHLLMYSHDYIMTFASQVAQVSINMEKIRKFEYYFPPIDEQIAFASFVAYVEKSKAVVQRALDEAQLLFDSLMQKYFG